MIKVSTQIILAIAASLIVLVYFQAEQSIANLEDHAIFSGYTALAVMVILVSFNLRKKISVLPLLKVRVWLVIHIFFGFALIILVVIHTRTLWPSGLYEQVIMSMFYLVSLSGIFGYVMSRTLPARLRHIGGEVIQERIPQQVYEIREAAKAKVNEGVAVSGSQTLKREYEESFGWFFAQPRFYFSHVTGSQRAGSWVEKKLQAIEPFMSGAESEKLSDIGELMLFKNKVDAHYAIQNFLKAWLLVHLPLSAVLSVFVLWHILLVHLFAV